MEAGDSLLFSARDRRIGPLAPIRRSIGG